MLAIGYLIVRGTVETACYVVLAVGWLMLAPLGEVLSAGPGTACSWPRTCSRFMAVIAVDSNAQALLFAPLAVQEMALAA